jgi:uncharacterized protein YkwD
MRSSRPHLRRASLTTALTQIGCAFFLVLVLAPGAYPQQTSDAGSEPRLFALINQERVKAGLPPLLYDERLALAARKHTQLMVHEDTLSHQLDGEESLQLRVSDENVRCDHDGENIALDSDLEVAHTMLMQSPHHRENILGPQFNSVGVGIVKSDDLIYITEDFAHVLPDYSELEADTVAQKAIDEYAKSQSVPVPVRKPRPQLKQMACDMALDDQLASQKAGILPGVSSAVAWNASDLGKLPANLRKLLAQPLTSGYSLGVCFAPSVTHPGGVYWLVMVIY